MITHRCPHPEPLHRPTGECSIRYCGCQILITLTHCGCPYEDCPVICDTASGLCPSCERFCQNAYQMESR